MKYSFYLILMCVFAVLANAPCPAPKAYINPVIPGFFPDPSVVRVGDDYYCVNSTFEYFTAIEIQNISVWEKLPAP